MVRPSEAALPGGVVRVVYFPDSLPRHYVTMPLGGPLVKKKTADLVKVGAEITAGSMFSPSGSMAVKLLGSGGCRPSPFKISPMGAREQAVIDLPAAEEFPDASKDRRGRSLPRRPEMAFDEVLERFVENSAVPQNAFSGWDVLVNGKHFDALQMATRTL